MKFDGQDDLSVCIRIFNHLNRISIRMDILSWTQGFGATIFFFLYFLGYFLSITIYRKARMLRKICILEVIGGEGNC